MMMKQGWVFEDQMFLNGWVWGSKMFLKGWVLKEGDDLPRWGGIFWGDRNEFFVPPKSFLPSGGIFGVGGG